MKKEWKERSWKRLKSYRRLFVSNNKDSFSKENNKKRKKKRGKPRCSNFKPRKENSRKEQE